MQLVGDVHFHGMIFMGTEECYHESKQKKRFFALILMFSFTRLFSNANLKITTKKANLANKEWKLIRLASMVHYYIALTLYYIVRHISVSTFDASLLTID